MKHRYFTLNEDEILHIVKHHLLVQLDFEQSQGKLGIVQAKDEEMHIISAFDDVEGDPFHSSELQSLAREIL